MTDYFFNSYPRSRLYNSKSQSDLYNNQKSSLFNSSGSEIIRNNKKNSIALNLKNDNILAHKQLNQINEEYNDMKDFLHNKVSKLEEQQQMQFDSLKNYLEEKNLLEDIRHKEKYRNNVLNEIKDEMEREYNKKKDLDKIRSIDYQELLGRRKASEDEERKKLMKEMEYFKRIKRINQMEKILLYNNRMKKQINDMYFLRYLPPHLQGLYQINNVSPFISPVLLNLLQRNDNEQRQSELMKLFLLKSFIDGENPKKNHPYFSRPPKYFIQKYYPPNSETKIVEVPQPVFFQAPEAPTPKYPPPPNIIIKRDPDGMLNPEINIITRNERRVKRTDRETSSKSKSHKKKHKHHKHHKHKKKHKKHHKKKKSKDDSESETEKKSEEEKSEKSEDSEKSNKESEKSEEESEKSEENEKKKEKDEEESSEPEVRLKLHDPDNPEGDKIIYPVNNQQ